MPPSNHLGRLDPQLLRRCELLLEQLGCLGELRRMQAAAREVPPRGVARAEVAVPAGARVRRGPGDARAEHALGETEDRERGDRGSTVVRSIGQLDRGPCVRYGLLAATRSASNLAQPDVGLR